VRARELDGSYLASLSPRGPPLASALESWGERTTVYNLEVESLHTYFVGEARVLVHNANPPNDKCTDDGRVTNPSKGDSPVWKGLKNYRAGIKTSGTGASTRYYTWDNLHNEIEVFDKRGKHLGVMDPTTGEFIKPPVPGRTIDL